MPIALSLQRAYLSWHPHLSVISHCLQWKVYCQLAMFEGASGRALFQGSQEERCALTNSDALRT